MPAANQFHISPQYQPLLRELGLDAESVFTHPDITVWRSIPERENCTLDATLEDGRAVRLHIKRYHAHAGAGAPADDEATGIRLLQGAGIATVPLVGWGGLADGRGFIITEDLAGQRAADQWVREGHPFEALIEPTARLVARLHGAGLHHRDLYLCHIFVREEFQSAAAAGAHPVSLIDAARVRRLPRGLFRRRWIIKDLAQFWYSTLELPITDVQRAAWLDCYAKFSGVSGALSLRRSIQRKASAIAGHDRSLRRKQPARNISIPRVPQAP